MKTLLTGFCMFALFASSYASGPYQATGIKICEVDQTSAIVWTRLTKNPERMDKSYPKPTVRYRNPETGELEPRRGRRSVKPVVLFSDNADIHTIEGAVPGTLGDVRLRYAIKKSDDWKSTPWRAVDPDRDFTRKIKLTDLQPGTSYQIEVQSRAETDGQTLSGRFRTAPSKDRSARVVFHVSTGQAYGDQDAPEGGYRIYASILKRDPDFFVHTGDIVYYDSRAKTLPLARWHWARMYSLPTNVAFHREVASYFIKDDHDTWMNDCWPGQQTLFMGEFTFEQGLTVFREQIGMGDRTYRTVRWGKDLQIWMVEGRDFRSPNPMPDGPEKTIWGKEQKAWFKETVRASDAAFRILISPTPVVGPDREKKNDNHANEGFTYEGDELRQFIAEQKNMVVVCGDRHWQYVSVDGETGVREYSCGPASDGHAGGWSNDKRLPEHRYLNVIGGFLEGVVDRENNIPVLIFRHFGVDGDLLNEDRFMAQH